MSDISVSEVFCEILSGLVLALLAVVTLDVAGAVPLEQSAAFLTKNISLADIAAVVAVCYLLGLVMDAIGLAVGELFLDNLVDSNVPDAAARERFWATVPEHVLKYRDIQWAYYSTYRNLFLLTIPLVGVLTIIAFRSVGWVAALLVIVGGAVLCFAFWKSMKALLGIYFRLTAIEYKKE